MPWANNDYVEVSERIRAWYSEHPEGRIETEVIMPLTDMERCVVVRAEVFRPGEQLPAGVGHSYLTIPGTTNFTRGSELENAETSAVGRALVMAGIPARSVASASEIKSKKSPSAASAGAKGQDQDWGRSSSSPAGAQEGFGKVAPESSAACPDCEEKAYTVAGLTDKQKAAGFVRCGNGTCERVYRRIPA